MTKKNKFLILIYGWLLFLLIVPVIAAAVTLKVKIPGNPNAGASPEAYIESLYNFGRIAVGITAFGVIVYAALEYTASAGNTARQQDARDRIKEAIIGIVLLFGATLVFNLINPDIWDTLENGLPLLRSTTVKPPPPSGKSADKTTTKTPATAGPSSQPQSGIGTASSKTQ